MSQEEKSTPSPEAPQQPSAGDGDKRPLPWAGWPDEIGCNFAAGNLVRNLQVPLGHQGRVQVETLMTAAGAVAGWGAQLSMFANAEALAEAEKQGQLTLVTMKDGRRMLFGDAINGMVTGANPALPPHSVWNYLAGTALAHGLPEAELPDLNGMFAHVARELGGPREGFPSTPPQHQPLASAGKVLERVQTLAMACLTGEFSKVAKENNFRAELTSYRVVTAWAAANILAQCAGLIPPKTALIIGMEAAIYASKLLPPSAPKSES